jgi:hypothetical protein
LSAVWGNLILCNYWKLGINKNLLFFLIFCIITN